MTTKEDIESIKNNTSEQQISCVFCLESDKYGKASLSQELVKEFFRVNGFTECNHDNLKLTGITLDLFLNIREYLQKISSNYDAMYGITSQKLIDILINQFENKDGPEIMMIILNTVGHSWLKSLNPNDYGNNIEHFRKPHMQLCTPPGHLGIKTEQGWLDTCGCDGCSGSYKEQKAKEQGPLENLYKINYKSFNNKKFDELDINQNIKEKIEEMKIIREVCC